MEEEMLIKKIKHSPTLNTILMVEEVIKNADESIVSIAYVKKHLPRQVNHNTLMQILEYLEESNKIAVSLKGITWIHNNNPNLRKAVSRGLEIRKKIPSCSFSSRLEMSPYPFVATKNY